MNDLQIELLTLVYWLIDRLDAADVDELAVPTAKLVAERLLDTLSPLTTTHTDAAPPDPDTAERQPTQIIH